MTSPPSIPAGVRLDTSMLRQLKKFDSAGGSDERCSFGISFQGLLPNVLFALTFYVVSNVLIKRMLRDNTNRIYSVILTFTCAATVFSPLDVQSFLLHGGLLGYLLLLELLLAPISFIRRNPFESVIFTVSFSPSSSAFYLGGLKETLVSDASRGLLCRSCTMRASCAMVLHA